MVIGRVTRWINKILRAFFFTVFPSFLNFVDELPTQKNILNTTTGQPLPQCPLLLYIYLLFKGVIS